MTTGIVIQARLGSTRFPRKVFANLCGRPVLLHVIERCLESKVGPIIVATPDEDVAVLARSSGVLSHVGSEHNVAKRIVNAAIENRLSRIIRVCADCPLIEPESINRLVDLDCLYGYVGFRHAEDSTPAIQTKVGLPEMIDTQSLVLMTNEAQKQLEHVTYRAYSHYDIPCRWIDVSGRRNEENAIDTPADLTRIEEWMQSRYPVAG